MVRLPPPLLCSLQGYGEGVWPRQLKRQCHRISSARVANSGSPHPKASVFCYDSVSITGGGGGNNPHYTTQSQHGQKYPPITIPTPILLSSNYKKLRVREGPISSMEHSIQGTKNPRKRIYKGYIVQGRIVMASCCMTSAD
jgi:hypothetical protein